MHLNTKKIAFAGVMLALTEVGIALGSVCLLYTSDAADD